MIFLEIGRPKDNSPPIADHIATNEEAKVTIEQRLADGSTGRAY